MGNPGTPGLTGLRRFVKRPGGPPPTVPAGALNEHAAALNEDPVPGPGTGQGQAAEAEHCEMCNEVLTNRHGHLVDTEKARVQLSPEALAKCVGRYEFREGSRNVAAFMGMTQNVTLVNGQLYLNVIPLIPQSDRKFDSTGAAAEFVLDANGKVSRLILSQPEGDGIYVPKR